MVRLVHEELTSKLRYSKKLLENNKELIPKKKKVRKERKKTKENAYAKWELL